MAEDTFDRVRLIGIGAAVTRRPLPHHRAYGSVHGGSSQLREPVPASEGNPRTRKYSLESPACNAVERDRRHGPWPLEAAWRARSAPTPNSIKAARRRRGVFHCCHIAQRNLRRTQLVSFTSVPGVSQNPK